MLIIAIIKDIVRIWEVMMINCGGSSTDNNKNNNNDN